MTYRQTNKRFPNINSRLKSSLYLLITTPPLRMTSYANLPMHFITPNFYNNWYCNTFVSPQIKVCLYRLYDHCNLNAYIVLSGTKLYERNNVQQSRGAGKYWTWLRDPILKNEFRIHIRALVHGGRGGHFVFIFFWFLIFEFEFARSKF